MKLHEKHIAGGYDKELHANFHQTAGKQQGAEQLDADSAAPPPPPPPPAPGLASGSSTTHGGPPKKKAPSNDASQKNAKKLRAQDVLLSLGTAMTENKEALVENGKAIKDSVEMMGTFKTMLQSFLSGAQPEA